MKIGYVNAKLETERGPIFKTTTPLRVRLTRKRIFTPTLRFNYAGLSLFFKAHLHQLYAELKRSRYDTFTHVRKGSVKFDFTKRKRGVKLRK